MQRIHGAKIAIRKKCNKKGDNKTHYTHALEALALGINTKVPKMQSLESLSTK